MYFLAIEKPLAVKRAYIKLIAAEYIIHVNREDMCHSE